MTLVTLRAATALGVVPATKTNKAPRMTAKPQQLDGGNRKELDTLTED